MHCISEAFCVLLWNLQPSEGINVFIRKYVQCFRHQACMLTPTPGLIPKLRALPINYIIGGRQKRKRTKDRLLSGVVQDAHRPCQLAWICSHIGDMPLKSYLKEFPERFNWEGKVHPEWARHPSVSWIEGKERKHTEQQNHSLSFLNVGIMWPAAPGSSCCSFLAKWIAQPLKSWAQICRSFIEVLW